MNRVCRCMCHLAVVLALSASAAKAQVPSKINYQGRLLRGTNLVNGVTNILLRLYTTPTGGVPIYRETNNNVYVSDGLYSFYIGDEASGLAAALTNSAVYMELVIGGQALDPREPIGSVAYAMLAGGMQNGSVTAPMLAPGAVGSSALQSGAVGSLQLVDAAVTAAKIQNGAVGTPQLAAGAVGTPQLADGAVTAAKIHDSAVGPGQLAAGAVGTSHLADGAVDTVKIRSGGVGTPQLADGAVTAAKIHDSAVGSLQLTDSAVTAAKLQNGAVGSFQLADGAVSSAKIQDGAVGTQQLNVAQLDSLYLPVSQWLSADATTNYVRRTGDRMSGDLEMAGYAVSNGVFSGDGSGLSGVVAAVSIPLSNVVWVAMNGTASGPGSIDRPFDTPQNGYNAASAGGAVVIASGSYSGSLGMNKANVHVIGLGRPVLTGQLLYSAASTPGRRVLVQNLTFGMGAMLSNGSDLKLFNCRVEGFTVVSSCSRIEFQSCCLHTDFGMALQLQAGNDSISINNSTIESGNQSAMRVESGNARLAVMGCEVATADSSSYAIDDQQSSALDPQHLFAHNHIQAPKNGNAVYAFSSQTMAFFHNTVQGNLAGSVNEYFANNTVIGTIAWGQADGGMAKDDWGNVRFVAPQLPDPWED